MHTIRLPDSLAKEIHGVSQELGYAEADPTSDVSGDDARNKLVIIARLAFGADLDVDTIRHLDPHERSKSSLIRIQIYKTLVHTHFPAFPCFGTLTIW